MKSLQFIFSVFSVVFELRRGFFRHNQCPHALYTLIIPRGMECVVQANSKHCGVGPIGKCIKQLIVHSCSVFKLKLQMNGFSTGEEDSRGPTDQICCLIDNGDRCTKPAGNASYSKRIQKTVTQRRLSLSSDSSVSTAYCPTNPIHKVCRK